MSYKYQVIDSNGKIAPARTMADVEEIFSKTKKRTAVLANPSRGIGLLKPYILTLPLSARSFVKKEKTHNIEPLPKAKLSKWKLSPTLNLDGYDLFEDAKNAK